MKMTLRNVNKLFKKMAKKLSEVEFEKFSNDFWTTLSATISNSPRIIIINA